MAWDGSIVLKADGSRALRSDGSLDVCGRCCCNKCAGFPERMYVTLADVAALTGCFQSGYGSSYYPWWVPSAQWTAAPDINGTYELPRTACVDLPAVSCATYQAFVPMAGALNTYYGVAPDCQNFTGAVTVNWLLLHLRVLHLGLYYFDAFVSQTNNWAGPLAAFFNWAGGSGWTSPCSGGSAANQLARNMPTGPPNFEGGTCGAVSYGYNSFAHFTGGTATFSPNPLP